VKISLTVSFRIKRLFFKYSTPKLQILKNPVILKLFDKPNIFGDISKNPYASQVFSLMKVVCNILRFEDVSSTISEVVYRHVKPA